MSASSKASPSPRLPSATCDGARRSPPRIGMASARPTSSGPSACSRAAPAPRPAPSEDCLYVNVWTGAKAATERRPVIVWTYGGGFTGGSGSEPRYDGEALARKGAVVVTYNYRLGAFGFFAHPELTKESDHNASGNYAMMDMAAVLHWVQRNIARFGGDPARVTIDGESAGAMLVSAMVGSPEGKGLFKRAISQSGAWMGIGIGKMTTHAQAEEAGLKLAQTMGAASLADLRAKSAAELAQERTQRRHYRRWLVCAGRSVGHLRERQRERRGCSRRLQPRRRNLLRPAGIAPNAEQFESRAKQRFGDLADSYAKVYPVSNDAEAAAAQLAGMRDEMGWHMRTWAQLQGKKWKG